MYIICDITGFFLTKEGNNGIYVDYVSKLVFLPSFPLFIIVFYLFFFINMFVIIVFLLM